MTKEGFVKLIETAQNYRAEVDKISELDLNFIDFSTSSAPWIMLDIVLPELFLDEGVVWINWWIFNRIDIDGITNKIYDENDKEIPTDTMEDLWNLVKNYQR